MSLRRKRRKRDQRSHHKRQPTRRLEPVREVDDARPLPGWTLDATRELGLVSEDALRARSDELGVADEAPLNLPSSSAMVREASEVRRLAYTRRQAAEALGVSVSTIDRRVVPAIGTVKTPWGQRLIPVDEFERFLRDHVAPARRRERRRRPAGRPPLLPRSVVERIRLEYARGRGLSEIARALTAEGVPTAHGGRKWWPSTVRAILLRPDPAAGRCERRPTLERRRPAASLASIC